jgi:hypothetical protein
MALASNVCARRVGGAVEIVPAAVRVSWYLNGMTTSDAHTMSGRFTVSVQLADNPTDRKMFAEVLLGSKSLLTISDLSEHFGEALRNAANETAPKRTVEQWLSGESRQEMMDALTKAAKAVAFACGLEILPPYQLELVSQSLNEKRLDEFSRARAEERAKGQMATLKRAGEVLAQFQEMRKATPEIPAGLLLERLAPADRGNVLQTLLAGSAEECERQTLWAVAGPSLLRIDARVSPAKIDTIDLTTKLGPLRSVQPANLRGKQVLLVGARSGIIAVEPNRADQATLYVDFSIQSDLGFNRAIVCGERVWGCHGQAGLVAWQIDNPTAPETRIPIPPDLPQHGSSGSSGSGRSRHVSPRNLQPIDDEYAVYSLGGAVKLLYGAVPVDLPTTNSSEVIAIMPESARLLIVREDGSIDVLDRITRQITASVRGAGKTCAAAALPWLGSVRLLLASDDGPVDCIGLDDSHVTRYTSRHSDLRVVTACPDQIAAISSDRQRLIIWRPWEASPATEIHVTAAVRHRLADIEFA